MMRPDPLLLRDVRGRQRGLGRLGPPAPHPVVRGPQQEQSRSRVDVRHVRERVERAGTPDPVRERAYGRLDERAGLRDAPMHGPVERGLREQRAVRRKQGGTPREPPVVAVVDRAHLARGDVAHGLVREVQRLAVGIVGALRDPEVGPAPDPVRRDVAGVVAAVLVLPLEQQRELQRLLERGGVHGVYPRLMTSPHCHVTLSYGASSSTRMVW